MTTTPKPNPQQIKQTAQQGQVARVLSRLVYLERESPFPLPKEIEAAPGTRVIRLGDLQRAVGVMEGRLLAFDAETCRGELEVEGRRFPCVDAQPPRMRKALVDLKGLLGQVKRFSFWPTWDRPPSGNLSGAERALLPELKLSRVRRTVLSSPGRVEAIGKLARLWPGGFEVTVWIRNHRRPFYVAFAGDYPYPDEVGQWVWVIGRFDPAARVIWFEEAEALAFVPWKEARKILRAQRKEKTQEPGNGRQEATLS